MIRKILTRNKRIYQAYNNNRKAIFMEQNARDSQSILFLLPWLLSINEPESPGYIKELIHPFRVYDIDYSKEIREREEEFKKQFNIKKRGSLLKSYSEYSLIHGLYTIGSVGSVAHTSSSDCDIWVCIDKNDFTKEVWQQLNFKINLIKDWMDTHLKIPVFFFISDINAIRNSCFGNVDQESSGSTQQDVLKEEFYRTCMLICGKTPLWWLCYDEHTQIRYIDALHSISGDDYWEYDLIDFGDIESINKKEYFGAALWQFHKSLSHPLKSMFKILHLKSSLDSPPEKLLCHQFREEVYQRGLKKKFS